MWLSCGVEQPFNIPFTAQMDDARGLSTWALKGVSREA